MEEEHSIRNMALLHLRVELVLESLHLVEDDLKHIQFTFSPTMIL